ncbi:hypothetical protein BONGO_46 [Mycobacterium phage Bongo]|uniref:Uncharacterized protein n=5 Tax=Bongovirus bongo TaxID=1983750 RepID=A0A514DJ11_9CAUD|nr:hypothetical protein PEGLEG_46 [Mycobacterium phage PegLeg]YP_009604904.1 hypothetical protein FDH95_gp046 [Mycobacterium phage Bongo]AXQ52687.1 hypothetical protein SEA_IPHANE7_46 [Mycobacterium phage IPhane7]QDH93619.1 hypothetical protein SEA_LILHOMIEP_45 [Mycobacterium phage LilhomieP]QGJ93193.1 hypothetical protein SEA_TYDAWG_46 [Mycobacterium phage TyDawg]AER26179.1 hypothetical protein BONGO_46 [Mycobacterium phage Bongo]AGM12297.1 hypothetical protein PEGLEG_46 [Mycobacterium phage
MSNNNALKGTGIKRVQVLDPSYALAVKVTGRNFAGVSYIVAQEAERRGIPMQVGASFNEDGSLAFVTVNEPGKDTHHLAPGSWVVLDPDVEEAVVMPESVYREHFREL